ncbi:hypothetical protein ACFWZ7_26195 [Nocardiopsis alba]|uniref:hypothetical protein n=1 Tax=Nocardiopsis alba TaxID=53437 RepID=UPI00366E409E
MNGKKNKSTTTDVVATLQEQVRQAQALAAVPEQKLLADARLNPQTRATADRLQAERLSTGLEMEHRRELRRVREIDRQEEERIRAAAAVDAARAATDESYTLLDMVRSRKTFSRVCLGASIVLSVGSAMGLEAAVATHYPDAPDGIGYISEVALTGMATAAIIWAGKLAAARSLPTGPAGAALVAMIAVPLVVSIIGSTIGSGPVGAVPSMGAAVFSAMAYLVATTSATAITSLLDRISRRTTTTATEVPAEDQGDDVLPRRSDRARDALEVVGEEIADQAADYLRTRSPLGDERGDDASSPGGDDGETGEIHPSTGGGDDAPAALEDAARRRSQTARQRVEDYYAKHPDAPVKGAAKELGVDPKTVRKYRPGGDS